MFEKLDEINQQMQSIQRFPFFKKRVACRPRWCYTDINFESDIAQYIYYWVSSNKSAGVINALVLTLFEKKKKPEKNRNFII